jgi:hypothetical protein
MKRLFLVFLFIGIALLYLGCSENSPIISELSQSGQVTNTLAKRPSPNLTGTTFADFTGIPPYFWVGTIIIDGVEYGMRYKNLSGPPRTYSGASPFEEEYEIWDELFETLYLKGTHAGVVSFANSRFVANGRVEEAYGPFEMWLGRNSHNSGIITWEIVGVLPDFATGTFRIN